MFSTCKSNHNRQKEKGIYEWRWVDCSVGQREIFCLENRSFCRKSIREVFELCDSVCKPDRQFLVQKLRRKQKVSSWRICPEVHHVLEAHSCLFLKTTSVDVVHHIPWDGLWQFSYCSCHDCSRAPIVQARPYYLDSIHSARKVADTGL